ncbi:MAG: hypothetical protein M1497_14570 [Nitrospirae bacterium]|nr:hypothetical protein [Nitrospirota bacterium]
MLIGYNTNVPYKGKMYHVQTEDSGPGNPYIMTLLYLRGAILRSIKTEYAHLVGSADFKERVRDLMKRQHREMIRGLITGKFGVEQVKSGREAGILPGQQGAEEPERKEGPRAKGLKKSLDEILLEHISKKGNR